MLDMSTDIHRIAVMNAPKDTRALINSGRIQRAGKAHYRIIFGGGSVPYARIHEFGGWTGRGGKTYITAKHYLGNAGDATSRNFKRYIRGI